ncbi:PEP-CTERM sorting domain-containing protein [Paraglaciecola arctica]|uniref:PEP-CTERM sorting domain-containing protein n=1 Tax=Paraglaciecola arctica TaxID=1128911 RepID=UPI001C077218|nr:PEP-CTERM sorting domain-containing protein [Paraglaciecola arctica]MBU3001875.1 PEP-CTERM sorting domain-containing protein [Paraglaciecola arctica]
MKPKFLKAVLIWAVLSISSFANASIISGNHHTDAGINVDLQGLEWLSWDETFNISRASIELGYGGYLDNGWRYATGAEFGILLSSISPQDGYGAFNNDATQWLWKTFDAPNFATLNGGKNTSRLGELFVGEDGECTSDLSMSCRGHVRAYTNGSGWLYDTYGRTGNFIHTMNKTYTGWYAQNGLASVLVRANPVPAPTTLAIFALGLIGLASRRFKKQS